MASPSSTHHPMEPITLATPQQIELNDSEVEMIEEETTEEVENEAETDDEMPELITDSDVEDEPSEDTPLIPEDEEEKEEETKTNMKNMSAVFAIKILQWIIM